MTRGRLVEEEGTKGSLGIKRDKSEGGDRVGEWWKVGGGGRETPGEK